MAIIGSVSHDTGDTSQYNSITTTGGDLTIVAAAAMGNTKYGMQVVVDDTNVDYGALTFTDSSGKVRFRFYIDPNSMTWIDNAEMNIARAYGQAADFHTICVINLNRLSGVWRIRAGIMVDADVHDSNIHAYTSYYSITDEPHYIEVYIQRATSDGANDGSLQLWIDGINKETISNLDNDHVFANLGLFRLGWIGNHAYTESGTYYLDELIINNDGGLIGPVPGLAFGVALPTTANESPISWDSENGAAIGWSNGAGASVTVSGDASWGKMELDIGEQGRSQVYDMGAVYTYTFTITENRYGTGSGTATLQYRTDTSAFLQDDANPAWTTYTVPFAVSCRYVQIRYIKSS